MLLRHDSITCQFAEFAAQACEHAGFRLAHGGGRHAEFLTGLGRCAAIDRHAPERLSGPVLEF